MSFAMSIYCINFHIKKKKKKKNTPEDVMMMLLQLRTDWNVLSHIVVSWAASYKFNFSHNFCSLT